MGENNIKQALSDVVAGLVLSLFCILLLIILITWVKLWMPISVIVSCVVFFGLFISFSRKQRENVIRIVNTTPEIKSILKDVEGKMSSILKYKESINDTNMQSKIDSVYKVTQQIFDVLQRDPRKVKNAKQFTSYYLDSTLKVIKSYVDLVQQEAVIDDTKKKIEDLLDTLKDAYAKQLQKLMANDVLDLNVEIQVLENLLKTET